MSSKELSASEIPRRLHVRMLAIDYLLTSPDRVLELLRNHPFAAWEKPLTWIRTLLVDTHEEHLLVNGCLDLEGYSWYLPEHDKTPYLCPAWDHDVGPTLKFARNWWHDEAAFIIRAITSVQLQCLIRSDDIETYLAKMSESGGPRIITQFKNDTLLLIKKAQLPWSPETSYLWPPSKEFSALMRTTLLVAERRKATFENTLPIETWYKILSYCVPTRFGALASNADDVLALLNHGRVFPQLEKDGDPLYSLPWDSLWAGSLKDGNVEEIMQKIIESSDESTRLRAKQAQLRSLLKESLIVRLIERGMCRRDAQSAINPLTHPEDLKDNDIEEMVENMLKVKGGTKSKPKP